MLIRPQLLPSEAAAYAQFCLAKSARANVDIYTAFIPFNEATRAFHTCFSLFSERPPGRILVLWDRSCYLARLVEAAFPDAEVTVTWEGDHDVLGRKGFAYWTADSQDGAPTPVFCDHTIAMKDFATGSFDLIVGMDLLHRVELDSFLSEIDRLLSPSGAAVFPHVHLSNNAPEPFFERGGTYRHGNTYAEVLHQKGRASKRRGFVHSEPALFRLNESGDIMRLTSAPDHDDYNGLVAWLPEDWFDSSGSLTFAAWQPERDTPEACRGLLNPLLQFDLHRGTITLDPEQHGGFAGRMMRRHPVYADFLKALDGFRLDLKQRVLLHHLGQGQTLQQAAESAEIAPQAALDSLVYLNSNGGLFLAPLKAEGHRMQQFLGNSTFRFSEGERTLPFAMQRRVNLDADGPFMKVLHPEDDSMVLSAADTWQAVKTLASGFLSGGMQPGMTIAAGLPPSPELLIVAWAAWQSGCIFSCREGDLEICDLDAFDEWMERGVETFVDWPIVRPEMPAVHLFTSGSTGRPKLIVLTHGQLVDSAAALVSGFALPKGIRHFVNHGLETMSGLRNAAVLPLFTGGVMGVLAGEHSIPAMLSLLSAFQPELLTGNPSFYHQLAAWSQRSGTRLECVKRPLCTGAPLPQQVRQAWIATGAQPLLNYYGLTETTGGFLAQRPGDTGDDVGRPVAGLVDLRNGALHVTGSCLSASAPVHNGFFNTRDFAEWTDDGTIRLIGRDVRRFKTADEELVLLDDIETALLALPLIADVHAVRRAEGPVEFAVALCKPAGACDLGAIESAMKLALIPKNLRPRIIHLVDDLPRNLAGKVPQQFIDDHLS